MKESHLHGEIRKSVTNGIYIKLNDMPMASGLRFNVKKPFDFIIVYYDVMVAIEAKMIKRYKKGNKTTGSPSLSLSDNRRVDIIEQIGNLQKVKDLNHLAYIMVNIRGDFADEEKRINKLYLIEPEVMLKLVNNTTSKSINKKVFDTIDKIEVKREKSIWLIDSVINEIIQKEFI